MPRPRPPLGGGGHRNEELVTLHHGKAEHGDEEGEAEGKGEARRVARQGAQGGGGAGGQTKGTATDDSHGEGI